MAVLGGFSSVLRRLYSGSLQRSFHDKLIDDSQLNEIAQGGLMLLVAGAAEAPERVAMMAHRIGIDPGALAERRSLLNEVTKRCATCRAKLACAFWLAENSDNEAFREFCPNAV